MVMDMTDEFHFSAFEKNNRQSGSSNKILATQTPCVHYCLLEIEATINLTETVI